MISWSDSRGTYGKLDSCGPLQPGSRLAGGYGLEGLTDCPECQDDARPVAGREPAQSLVRQPALQHGDFVKADHRGQQQPGLLPLIEHNVLWCGRESAGDAGHHNVFVASIKQNQSRTALQLGRVSEGDLRRGYVAGRGFTRPRGRLLLPRAVEESEPEEKR